MGDKGGFDRDKRLDLNPLCGEHKSSGGLVSVTCEQDIVVGRFLSLQRTNCGQLSLSNLRVFGELSSV